MRDQILEVWNMLSKDVRIQLWSWSLGLVTQETDQKIIGGATTAIIIKMIICRINNDDWCEYWQYNNIL